MIGCRLGHLVGHLGAISAPVLCRMAKVMISGRIDAACEVVALRYARRKQAKSSDVVGVLESRSIWWKFFTFKVYQDQGELSVIVLALTTRLT